MDFHRAKRRASRHTRSQNQPVARIQNSEQNEQQDYNCRHWLSRRPFHMSPDTTVILSEVSERIPLSRRRYRRLFKEFPNHPCYRLFAIICENPC